MVPSKQIKDCLFLHFMEQNCFLTISLSIVKERHKQCLVHFCCIHNIGDSLSCTKRQLLFLELRLLLSAIQLFLINLSFGFTRFCSFLSQNNRIHNEILYMIQNPMYSQSVWIQKGILLQEEELPVSKDYTEITRQTIHTYWNVRYEVE